MRLANSVIGTAFGLRSPMNGDALFTVRLRSEAEASRHLHRIPNDAVAQRGWEQRALASDDDLPLIIFRTTTGAAVGTTGIYRIDRDSRSAEWGRWVISPGSLAAVESVALVFRVAFDHLSLERLYSRTLQQNTRVLSFHDGLGLTRVAEGRVDVDGADEVYVEHLVTSVQAPALRCRLESLAARIAQRLS